MRLISYAAVLAIVYLLGAVGLALPPPNKKFHAALLASKIEALAQWTGLSASVLEQDIAKVGCVGDASGVASVGIDTAKKKRRKHIGQTASSSSIAASESAGVGTATGCAGLCKGSSACNNECDAIQSMLCPATAPVASAVAADSAGPTGEAAYAAYAAAESVKDEVRRAIRSVGQEGVRAVRVAQDVAVQSVKTIEKKVIGKGTSAIVQAAAQAAAHKAVEEEAINVKSIAETSAASAMASVMAERR